MTKLLLKERVLLYSSEFCLRELFNYNNCEKVKCDNNSRVKVFDDRTVGDLYCKHKLLIKTFQTIRYKTRKIQLFVAIITFNSF